MAAMSNHHVIFDLNRPNLAHTRIDCVDHFGLIEAVEQLGYAVDDPDVFDAAVDLLGLTAPAHLADRAVPCPTCTLVAAPLWLSAA